MMRFRYVRVALLLAASVVTLGGCGPAIESRSMVPASEGAAARSRDALLYVARNGTKGPLLYVLQLGRGSRGTNDVLILTFPQGKHVATISGSGNAGGVCVDASGNVWVPYNGDGKAAYVDEFAHGGTKVIAELRIRKARYVSGCAVDPSSGNLAVLTDPSTYGGYAVVWRGASGKPTVHKVPFVPMYATYDSSGNLYIAGVRGGSDFWLVLGALSKGGHDVAEISLPHQLAAPGGIQWDGSTLALAGTRFYGRRGRIYRIEASASGAKIVGKIQTRGLFRLSPIWLYSGEVIGTEGDSGEHLTTWAYPGGGYPSKRIAQYEYIHAIAVSK
jgi:hypothetical protein